LGGVSEDLLIVRYQLFTEVLVICPEIKAIARIGTIDKIRRNNLFFLLAGIRDPLVNIFSVIYFN
jgi:hypothetical protein